MALWVLAGYVVTALAFYSYIVSTAQEETQERAATVVDLTEWQRGRDDQIVTKY